LRSRRSATNMKENVDMCFLKIIFLFFLSEDEHVVEEVSIFHDVPICGCELGCYPQDITCDYCMAMRQSSEYCTWYNSRLVA
jgi:hypothetical protein